VTPGNRLHLESQNIPADVLFELLKTEDLEEHGT
jgi:hypothetical protein